MIAPNLALVPNLTLEFTQNPCFIEAYLKIREYVYITEFNLGSYEDHRDEYDHDPNTAIVVVRKGNQVIGGSRCTMRVKGSNNLLPHESDEFKLIDNLPELKLRNKSYIEVTRMALLPEYRDDGTIARNLIELQIQGSIEKGATFGFTVTPLIQARNNRNHIRRIGFNMVMRPDIIIPDKPLYRGRKMVLSTIDFTKPHVVGDHPNTFVADSIAA
ncbi:MAG: GNAT family N-acetyltransferase [Alphaproteobacteria bacterium]|nr:GNAT family N-acetyltransferase [Alphaproteobacteria bacterium]